MTKAEKQKTVPVASLKSMPDTPPEFAMPVSIRQLGGDPLTITFTAKALRKTQWAAMRDETLGLTKAEPDEGAEPAPAEKFSYLNAVGGDMRKMADLVLKLASGWDLEDEFSAANLIDMEDRFGGALGAVAQAYDAAIFHGRLGN
jgi:hypothetical protein